MTEIRPTGTLRAWGWPLVVVGAFLTLALFSHPYVGAAIFAAGMTLVVIAAKRAAANREAVQRATLETPTRP